MNFITVSLVGLFALVQTATVAAADTVYECSLVEQRVNRGWIPTTVVVSYTPGGTEALVNDQVIMTEYGKPITVPIREETAERLTLSWKMTLTAKRASGVIMTYTFSLFKGKKTAQMRALPHGYDNTFRSQGTCKLVKS